MNLVEKITRISSNKKYIQSTIYLKPNLQEKLNMNPHFLRWLTWRKKFEEINLDKLDTYFYRAIKENEYAIEELFKFYGLLDMSGFIDKGVQLTDQLKKEIQTMQLAGGK